jgi:hypothetical protein
MLRVSDIVTQTNQRGNVERKYAVILFGILGEDAKLWLVGEPDTPLCRFSVRHMTRVTLCASTTRE